MNRGKTLIVSLIVALVVAFATVPIVASANARGGTSIKSGASIGPKAGGGGMTPDAGCEEP